MKIWIDLANSPHALLFAPIAARLTNDGHQVLVTARAHAQTVELASKWCNDLDVVGGHSPRARVQKALTVVSRVRSLSDWAKHHRPDVALSHNSYAQILAARVARVPAVTAMDYEHQPANHLAFRAAERILLPAVLRTLDLRRQGAIPRKVRYYDGFKEELYVADFDPSEEPEHAQGGHNSATALVVVRTPPAGALYHRTENTRFGEIVRRLDVDSRCSLVVLPRDDQQRRELQDALGPRTVIAEQAVDSRPLLFHADLFVGAGGTMTREAALLGVPTYSLFAARRPRVDSELERRGLMRHLAATEDVVVPPPTPHHYRHERLLSLRKQGDVLVRQFSNLAMQVLE